jgi:hypothetical protein
MPNQVVTSNPGTVSATIGTPGIPSARQSHKL